jgi:hypothetical protein
MKNLLRTHSFVAAAAAALGILAFGTLMVDRSSAFTQIERQFAFDPIEITVDQTAHVVVNNTFGAQEIHVSINWGDGVSGAPIGSPFEANLMPGQGVVALLPAVQTPPADTAPGATRTIIVVCRVSSAPGVAALPLLLGNQITGSLNVLDQGTGHVSVSRGFGIIPAVQ